MVAMIKKFVNFVERNYYALTKFKKLKSLRNFVSSRWHSSLIIGRETGGPPEVDTQTKSIS